MSKKLQIKYANEVYHHMWSSSSLRHKIVLGLSQGLDCNERIRLASYTRTHDKRYNGIHMYGVSGLPAFTRSVSAIISSVHSQPQHQ